jgi:hypothetical protein
VGYEGDANHGRGHHLHLSWSHSMSRPGRPARTVYTTRCPSPAAPIPPPAPPPEPPPLAGGTEVGAPVKDSLGEGGGHGGGGHHEGDGRPSAGSGGVGGAGHGSGSGGIGGRTKIAPAVAETGGVGIGAASRG